MSERALDLDILTVRLGPEGLDPFVWPIGRDELATVKATLEQRLAAVAAAIPTSSESGHRIRLLIPYYVPEALAALTALATTNRLRRLGLRPVPPRRWRLLPAFLAGQVPDEPPFLRELRLGPTPMPRWNFAERLGRQLYRRDRIRRKGLKEADVEHDIILTKLDPFIRHHARCAKESITYVDPAEWFDEVDTDWRNAINFQEDALVSALLSATWATFPVLNEQPVESVRAYLNAWWRQALGTIAVHLGRLDAAQDRLPRRLWTGTGGNVWARLLRHAVQRRGGHVTGHDHAIGVGAWLGRDQTLTELVDVDRFVTLNPRQASALERDATPEFLPDGSLPEITTVGCRGGPDMFSPRARISQVFGRLRRRGRRPRILLHTKIYRGERAQQAPIASDIVSIDWHTRLIAQLTNWGYEVLHRPHPESEAVPDLGAKLGVSCAIAKHPFEVAMDQSDLILFAEQPKTTTLRPALTSNLPVVIIDLGMHAWDPEARDHLQQRGVLVAAHTNDDNRVVVDWQDLRNALELSERLRGSSFVNLFLAYH